jgi:hypothetical protein
MGLVFQSLLFSPFLKLMAKITVRYVAKKAEYGYSGQGYFIVRLFILDSNNLYTLKTIVVEFECDPKYLKGLIVDKGLWRVNSDPNYKVSSSFFLSFSLYFFLSFFGFSYNILFVLCI